MTAKWLLFLFFSSSWSNINFHVGIPRNKILIGCYYLAQIFMELMILLPQPSQCHFLLLIGEHHGLGDIIPATGRQSQENQDCKVSSKYVEKKEMSLCCY
jgi:hypothetical protein